MNRYRRAMIMSFCAILFTAVQICPAVTLTCAAGDVACLIAAIHLANSTPEADTIQLAAGTYTLTTADNITDEANGLPSIMSAVTIQGAGADQTIVERQGNAPAFRLVHMAATGTLILDGLTLAGGLGLFGGGGIRNDGGHVTIMDSIMMNNQTIPRGGGGLWNSGTVRILRSTLTDNIALTSGSGGGIYNEGTLRLLNSTLTDNLSDEAGGLYNSGGLSMITNSTVAHNHGGQPGGGVGGLLNDGGTLTLLNSTVVVNHGEAGAHSGGVVNYGGNVFLQNTILAHNSKGRPGPSGPDCFGTITSLGHNVIGDPTGCTIVLHPTDRTGDPGLGEFTDNGTPGDGHFPLLATSQAMDAGDDSACPATDQLGNPHVGPCDIGAVEFQSPDRQPPALALTLNQTAFRPGDTLRMGVHLRNPGPILTTDAYVGVILPDGQTVLWLTNTAPLQGVVSRLDADPRTFTPMLRNASWPAGLDVTQEGYLSYRFTGGEAPGVYHLLVGWTKPGSLADGRIDEGDVLALDWKAVQFTGPASTLAAKAQEIRARYATE
jgi:uncharacterized repeat protein (TIGR01451 family)